LAERLGRIDDKAESNSRENARPSQKLVHARFLPELVGRNVAVQVSQGAIVISY
jgi:hypothetical protein